MGARNERRDGQAGYTLVEMLVVLVITGVVGGIVTSGIVTSFKVSHRAEMRIAALSELQLAAERIGRELRSASPLVMSPTYEFANEVVSQVDRAGKTEVHTFRVRTTPGRPDEIVQSVKVYVAGVDPFTKVAGVFPTPQTTMSTVLITTTSNKKLGRATFAYFQGPGQPLVCPAATPPADCVTVYSDARLLGITLTRDLEDGQPPLELTTYINIRNTRYGS